MKRCGLTIVAAAMLAPCLAQAADLEVVKGEQPTIYVPNYFVWGGIYVGGFLGGGRGTADWGPGSVTVSLPSGSATSTASLFIPHENVSIGGFLGGGRVGANYQAGPFVFGFEGDFTGMTLKGHTTASFTGTTTTTSTFGGTTTKVDYTTTSTYRTTADWASTFTGRVGYTFDRVLAYGKAGVAVEQDGDTEVSTTTCNATTPPATTPTACTPSTTNRAGTATRYGWTVGAGLEYAFDKHWSGFVEYDHLGFLSQIINFSTVTVPALPAGAGAATTTRLVALNIDRVVGGVDYRF